MPDVHDTPLRAQFEPKIDGTNYLPYTPNPSQSLKLPANRQVLVDAVIAVYSSKVTEEAMLHYAKESVYDDPLSFCVTRRQIAGQWYALPKCFSRTQVEEYEVIQQDPIMMKFKTVFEAKVLGSKEVEHLVTLVTTEEDGQLKIKYHKDMWNEKDYSHGASVGAMFKKFNGASLPPFMNLPKSL